MDQLDSFSALSILKSPPPSPLQAASLDCPPVLQVQQSDGTRAHFRAQLFFLQSRLAAENIVLGKILAAEKENRFAYEWLTLPPTGANCADVTLGILTRKAL